jgi:hypothetical protein
VLKFQQKMIEGNEDSGNGGDRANGNLRKSAGEVHLLTAAWLKRPEN